MRSKGLAQAAVPRAGGQAAEDWRQRKLKCCLVLEEISYPKLAWLALEQELSETLQGWTTTQKDASHSPTVDKKMIDSELKTV